MFLPAWLRVMLQIKLIPKHTPKLAIELCSISTWGVSLTDVFYSVTESGGLESFNSSLDLLQVLILVHPVFLCQHSVVRCHKSTFLTPLATAAAHLLGICLVCYFFVVKSQLSLQNSPMELKETFVPFWVIIFNRHLLNFEDINYSMFL